MDGASKFVKGDAIAGLDHRRASTSSAASRSACSSRAWASAEALQTFSLLTIGDGLVAQIPALLISTATGIIVTRAATDAEYEPRPRHRDQICASRGRSSSRRGVLGAFGLVPGLPHVPFLLIARAHRRLRRRASARRQRDEARRAPTLDGGREAQTRAAGAAGRRSRNVAQPRPARARDRLRPDPAGGRERGRRAAEARRARAPPDGHRARPRARADPHPRQRPARLARATPIRIKGVEVARGELVAGQPAGDEPGRRRPLARRASATVEPAFGLPALWIAAAAREQAEASGYTVVDHASVIITHLTETIRRTPPSCSSRQDAQHAARPPQGALPGRRRGARARPAARSARCSACSQLLLARASRSATWSRSSRRSATAAA